MRSQGMGRLSQKTILRPAFCRKTLRFIEGGGRKHELAAFFDEALRHGFGYLQNMRAMPNMAAILAMEIGFGSGAAKISPDAAYWAIHVQVDMSFGLGIEVMDIVDVPDQFKYGPQSERSCRNP